MSSDRHRSARHLIRLAGLPEPLSLGFSKTGRGVSAEFRIERALEAYERCGATDEEAVADLVRQFREQHE